MFDAGGEELESSALRRVSRGQCRTRNGKHRIAGYGGDSGKAAGRLSFSVSPRRIGTQAYRLQSAQGMGLGEGGDGDLWRFYSEMVSTNRIP